MIAYTMMGGWVDGEGEAACGCAEGAGMEGRKGVTKAKWGGCGCEVRLRGGVGLWWGGEGDGMAWVCG